MMAVTKEDLTKKYKHCKGTIIEINTMSPNSSDIKIRVLLNEDNNFGTGNKKYWVRLTRNCFYSILSLNIGHEVIIYQKLDKNNCVINYCFAYEPTYNLYNKNVISYWKK